jgi:hypothetical protein
MTEFEKQVLEDLAELKAHMRSLVGNGQPGRVQELEVRVQKHEAFVQRAGGLGAALAALATVVHFALDYLRS